MTRPEGDPRGQLQVTPDLVRAAREQLGWSRDDLAQRAGVAASAIAEFEDGRAAPSMADGNLILRAMERAGVLLAAAGSPPIQALNFHLMSGGSAADFAMAYAASGAAAVRDVLAVFGEADGDEVSLNAIQAASPALKAGLDALVARYAGEAPQIHQLKKFIRDLDDDEHFLLLPERPPSTAQRLACEQLIYRLNYPGEAPAEGEGGDPLFALLLERFDMDTPRTDRKAVIGSRTKAERKCRFCHRTAADGATYKSAAHAISTALGNDHLKLADECDSCNAYFGQAVEPSLIALLDIQRVFLGIQGRGKNSGRPELRFAEGKMHHDGQKVNLESSSFTRDDATGIMTVDLGKGPTIVPVAAHKALVKIALSVVDAEALPHLRKTIEWLRYDQHAGLALPTIAAATVNLPPNASAQIIVYRRKAAASRLPHLVGEFRLGCYVYVFAVPFSDRNSWDLVGFFDDAEFRETFKHYAAAGPWTQQDLSRRSKVALSPRIKFVPRDS